MGSKLQNTVILTLNTMIPDSLHMNELSTLEVTLKKFYLKLTHPSRSLYFMHSKTSTLKKNIHPEHSVSTNFFLIMICMYYKITNTEVSKEFMSEAT